MEVLDFLQIKIVFRSINITPFAFDRIWATRHNFFSSLVFFDFLINQWQWCMCGDINSSRHGSFDARVKRRLNANSLQFNSCNIYKVFLESDHTYPIRQTISINIYKNNARHLHFLLIILKACKGFEKNLSNLEYFIDLQVLTFKWSLKKAIH